MSRRVAVVDGSGTGGCAGVSARAVVAGAGLDAGTTVLVGLAVTAVLLAGAVVTASGALGVGFEVDIGGLASGAGRADEAGELLTLLAVKGGLSCDAWPAGPLVPLMTPCVAAEAGTGAPGALPGFALEIGFVAVPCAGTVETGGAFPLPMPGEDLAVCNVLVPPIDPDPAAAGSGVTGRSGAGAELASAALAAAASAAAVGVPALAVAPLPAAGVA